MIAPTGCAPGCVLQPSSPACVTATPPNPAGMGIYQQLWVIAEISCGPYGLSASTARNRAEIWRLWNNGGQGSDDLALSRRSGDCPQLGHTVQVFSLHRLPDRTLIYTAHRCGFCWYAAGAARGALVRYCPTSVGAGPAVRLTAAGAGQEGFSSTGSGHSGRLLAIRNRHFRIRAQLRGVVSRVSRIRPTTRMARLDSHSSYHWPLHPFSSMASSGRCATSSMTGETRR